MRYILFMVAIFFSFSGYAQVYQGKGDKKIQVGADFQENATGIAISYDQGLGQNFSIGLIAHYALGLADGLDPNFDERSSLKLRLNANLGDVINLSPNFDIYPGLNIGTKNFGGHVGARYFFTNGFGVYSEVSFPLSKYKTEDLNANESFYNQFVFTIGTSFNLL
ncbi:MAG: DUF6646 family protein [Nonlabens sp.]